MSGICVDNLSKSFGENKVLDGVSLFIPEGKTTCLMGPSGCGKTTLINLLLGLEKADGGTIRGVPSKVSVVFQEDRLFESFTALSNIKAVSDRETAERLIKAMGLEGSGNKPVSELSGGMKRRVAIARALAYGGELTVMDEPFKGLDEGTKEAVAAYVKDALFGKTALVVTHDINEAKALGAFVVAMSADGKIETNRA